MGSRLELDHIRPLQLPALPLAQQEVLDFLEKSQVYYKEKNLDQTVNLLTGDFTYEVVTTVNGETYDDPSVQDRIEAKGDLRQSVYPAMVRELDWHIGEILKELEKDQKK